MKGVELPINILVIVAIAVIVLLGLVALYFVGFGPFSATAGIEAVKNQACTVLNPRAGCTAASTTIDVNYDVNGDGNIENDGTDPDDDLESFAAAFYGCADEACVKRLCGCPGY